MIKAKQMRKFVNYRTNFIPVVYLQLAKISLPTKDLVELGKRCELAINGEVEWVCLLGDLRRIPEARFVEELARGLASDFTGDLTNDLAEYLEAVDSRANINEKWVIQRSSMKV